MTTVYLCNASTYAASTVIVPQTITSESSTQITFDVVRGALSLGSAWVVVLNDFGEYSSGYEISLASGKKRRIIMNRIIATQAAIATAVSWTIYVDDAFDVPRIDLKLSAAPTTAGSVTVTKDSVAGASYDAVIATVDAVGKTSIPITGLEGLAKGDKLVVAYANPDTRTITGTATIEVVG